MQKVSNQLRSSITNVTRHRGDKVPVLKCSGREKIQNPGVTNAFPFMPSPYQSIMFLNFICVFQNAIHNHIRLFEPLVIKALKQYTTSTSVALQRQVLDLLAQLVQLRVNYCLLDSDQVSESDSFPLDNESC